jgi:hypothetical protein
MDVLVSDRALDFVRERGGHVWIWLDVRRCCSGAVSYLGASCAEPRHRRGALPRTFRTIAVNDVTIHASLGRRRPPDELHVDVRGHLRPRIEAYWNGCVFIDDRGPVSRTTPRDGARQTTPA